MKPTIAALVPMRHDCKRVPGKNYRPFCGRPLYHHILRSLLGCPLITQVVIDTDSDLILEDAARHFPTVTLLGPPRAPPGRHHAHERRAAATPSSRSTPTSTSRPTAPTPCLRPPPSPAPSRPSSPSTPPTTASFPSPACRRASGTLLARPVNHNPAILLRTQDLPPVYEENSCLYLFTRQTLEAAPQPHRPPPADVRDRPPRGLGHRRRSGFPHRRAAVPEREEGPGLCAQHPPGRSAKDS